MRRCGAEAGGLEAPGLRGHAPDLAAIWFLVCFVIAFELFHGVEKRQNVDLYPLLLQIPSAHPGLTPPEQSGRR